MITPAEGGGSGSRPGTPILYPPEDKDETSDLDSENTNVEKKVDLNSLNEIRDLYSSVRDDSKRLNLQLEQLEDLLENTFGIEVTRKEKEGQTFNPAAIDKNK